MTALAILAQVSALSEPAPLAPPAAAASALSEPVPSYLPTLTADAHVPRDHFSLLPDVLLGVIGSYLPLGGYGLRTLYKSLLASNAFGFITTKYGTSEFGNSNRFYPTGGVTASKVIAFLHKTVNNWRACANLDAEREGETGYWMEDNWNDEWGPFKSDKLNFEKNAESLAAMMHEDLDAALIEIEARGAKKPFILSTVLNRYDNEQGQGVLGAILDSWWHGEVDRWRGDEENERLSKFVAWKEWERNGYEITFFYWNMTPSRKIKSADGVTSSKPIIKCDRYKKYATKVLPFGCVAKWCWNNGHVGCFCEACMKEVYTEKCSFPGCLKRGCKCSFFTCANEECENKMCAVSKFSAWKRNEAGAAPGHSYFVPPPHLHNDEEDEDFDEEEHWERWRDARQTQWCHACRPEGAVEMRNHSVF
jgi:hypothetical protein